MSDAPRMKSLNWDGTITAGNVLTAGTLLIGLLVWGLRLEGRVDRGEERQLRFEATTSQYRTEDRASQLAAMAELRGSLRRIEGILMEQGREARRGATP